MDIYNLLNVNKNSSMDDIKKSYHALSLKYHPDKNNDPDAKEMFIKIKTAYEILTDEKKKFAYNNLNLSEKNVLIDIIFNNFYTNDIKSMVSNFLFGKLNNDTIIEHIINIEDIYYNEKKKINVISCGKNVELLIEPKPGEYLFKNKGTYGENLVVKVIFLKNNEFTIIDNDVIIIKIISLAEYIYGGTIIFTHIDGRIFEIDFKSMLDSHPIITIDNEGIRNTNGKLYIILKINKININIDDNYEKIKEYIENIPYICVD